MKKIALRPEPPERPKTLEEAEEMIRLYWNALQQVQSRMDDRAIAEAFRRVEPANKILHPRKKTLDQVLGPKRLISLTSPGWLRRAPSVF